MGRELGVNSELLGSIVRARRGELNMTTLQLAKRIGMTQAQISRLETGKQGFRSETLLSLSNALDVSPTYFFIGEDGIPTNKELFKFNPSTKIRTALRRPEFREIVTKQAGAYLENVREFKKTTRLIEAVMKMSKSKREGLLAFLED